MIWDILQICLIIIWGFVFSISKEYWEKVHSATWVFTLIIQLFASQIAPITVAVLFIIVAITWVINIIILLNEKNTKAQLCYSIIVCLLAIAQSIYYFTLG